MRRALDNPEHVTAKATRLIAIFTVVLALASVVSIFMLKSQLNEMHHSEVETIRAWMTVSGTGFGYKPSSLGLTRTTGRIIISDTGPSPAFNIHVRRCAQVRAAEPNEGDLGSSGANCIDRYLGIAGKDVPVTLDLDASEQEVPNLSVSGAGQQGKHYYTWGEITYDINERDRRHKTSFCLLNAGEQLSPCNNGNDAD